METQNVLSEINNRSFKVAAVIPAYNEARFIGSVVIRACWHADVVFVVDDGSVDTTAQVAEAAGAVVVRQGQNRGKAAAIAAGFEHALGINPDVIVMLDGDGQHDPAEIPDVIRPLLSQEADMVIGSRFQGTEVHVPVWRRAGQYALTLATNLTSGNATSDSQSGFRAFTSQALRTFQIRSSGFAIESEMQFWAAEQNLRVAEAPINCLYEEKAKRNPVLHGLQVLRGILNLVSRARPLFFFSAVGLLSLLLGLSEWWWTIYHYGRTGDFAMPHSLIATFFIIFGVLSIFQGITLHTIQYITNKFSTSETAARATGFSREDHAEEHSMPLHANGAPSASSAPSAMLGNALHNVKGV